MQASELNSAQPRKSALPRKSCSTTKQTYSANKNPTQQTNCGQFSHVRMRAYVTQHTYTRTHLHTYTRTHVHTYTRTHVHTYAHSHAHTRTHTQHFKSWRTHTDTQNAHSQKKQDDEETCFFWVFSNPSSQAQEKSLIHTYTRKLCTSL